MSHQYSDAQRMELRSFVNLAGESVARLWPLRTFISRNPLQGFEHLPFEDAVQRGKQLFGADGFLPLAWYRTAWREGRIATHCLTSVLEPLTTGKQAQLGDRVFSHLEVLQAALTNGIYLSDDPNADADSGNEPGDEEISPVLAWAEAALPHALWEDCEDLLVETADAWPSREMLAAWCDRTIGTELVESINREVIKWLTAFCDEGEAAWAMPYRDQTFFRSWKASARYDHSLRLMGVKGAAKKITALSDRPEDALLESLDTLKIPPLVRQEYLALHLAALPGWAGFVKWRADQSAYPWQEAHRIDLVKYLAIRLFYERELVATACRRELDCHGDVASLQTYARNFPHALWYRRALLKGRLGPAAEAQAGRLRRWGRRADAAVWESTGTRWYETTRVSQTRRAIARHVRALLRLADGCNFSRELILRSAPSEVATILGWLRSFPARLQHLKWLEAHELTHEQTFVQRLSRRPLHERPDNTRTTVRPLAQFVFCIDVRSEVFRRHLEQRGGYETFGFAGFFGLPVAFRSLDESHESELCPVLLKPKHVLREVPRAYDGQSARRRRASQQAAKMGRELLHDLKHNVITPYVMVEAVGWFFSLPLLGKTLLPRWYDRVIRRLSRLLSPQVATALTVDKLTPTEADEMVAADQRRRILQWLRAYHQVDGSQLTPDRLEAIRLQALDDAPTPSVIPGELGQLLVATKQHENDLLEALRRDCRLTPRETSARIDRITQTGFTLNEQAYYVETALRLMGFTSNFSRLIFLCGHGSTSQNNPYESALDCGACGGSSGLPNARAFATIANRPQVRALLAKRGIEIPADTHFVPALHDTTTDRLFVADIEDVPSTHRKELSQVLEDLNDATVGSAAERYVRLDDTAKLTPGDGAIRAVEQRSRDWAQVRPEWGLARNSLFIIGGRRLTGGTDLEGRAFLHSYDHRIDPDGRLLEVIMTAPLIVAQWINSEYYFSTVAPDSYGSGSKVYHNVTGRFGVITGNRSDLRMGLPVQSLFDGTALYHEPLRLTAVIEAPRELVTAVIARQPLLQQLFNNRWLRLLVLEPNERRLYRYAPQEGWIAADDPVVEQTPALSAADA